MGKIHGRNLQALVTWLKQRKNLQKDIKKYIHYEKRKKALVLYKPLCYEIVIYHENKFISI